MSGKDYSDDYGSESFEKDSETQSSPGMHSGLMSETDSDVEKFNILKKHRNPDFTLFHDKKDKNTSNPRQYQKSTHSNRARAMRSYESTSEDDETYVAGRTFAEINTNPMESSPPPTLYSKRYGKGTKVETPDRKASATVTHKKLMESRPHTAPVNKQRQNVYAGRQYQSDNADTFKRVDEIKRNNGGSGDAAVPIHKVAIAKHKVLRTPTKRLPSNRNNSREDIMQFNTPEKLIQKPKVAAANAHINDESELDKESSTGTEVDRVLTTRVTRLKAQKQPQAKKFVEKNVKPAQEDNDEIKKGNDDDSKDSDDKSEDSDRDNGSDNGLAAESDERTEESSGADDSDEDSCENSNVENSTKAKYEGQNDDSAQSVDENKTVIYNNIAEDSYEEDYESVDDDEEYEIDFEGGDPVASESSDNDSTTANKDSSNDYQILGKVSQQTFTKEDCTPIESKSYTCIEPTISKPRKVPQNSTQRHNISKTAKKSDSHYRNTYSTTSMYSAVSRNSHTPTSIYSAAGGKGGKTDDACKSSKQLHTDKKYFAPIGSSRTMVETVSGRRLLSVEGSATIIPTPSCTSAYSHNHMTSARSSQYHLTTARSSQTLLASAHSRSYSDNPHPECGKSYVIDCEVSEQLPLRATSDDFFFHLMNQQQKKKTSNRKSFSFSNERMREISRHNMILLKKIQERKPTYVFSTQTSSNQKFSNLPPSTKVTNSAVNRRKQQRQIDLDNMVLKRKIQAISTRKSLH